MAKDERIFRITKEGYRKPRIKYASRTQVSAMFAHYGYGNSKRPDILKIEAIDPADVEWADVTEEFRNKPEPRCYYHRTYTGVRKPTIWEYKQELMRSWYSSCTCWQLYAEKHPEYPTHDPLCTPKHLDPATCSCQVLKKLAPPGNEPQG